MKPVNLLAQRLAAAIIAETAAMTADLDTLHPDLRARRKRQWQARVLELCTEAIEAAAPGMERMIQEALQLASEARSVKITVTYPYVTPPSEIPGFKRS